MLTLQGPKARRNEAVVLVLKRKGKRKARQVYRLPPPRLSEVIQVFRGEALVGNICLDDTENVLSCDPAIPKDVAFKALVLSTRKHQLSGEVVGRQDGETYRWDVVDEDELEDLVAR
jgi:hypothetical protein